MSSQITENPINTDQFVETNEKINQHKLEEKPELITTVSSLPDDVKKNMVGYEKLLLEEQLYNCLLASKARIVKADDFVFTLHSLYKITVDRMRIIRTLNDMAKQGKVVKVSSPRGYSLADV